MTILLLFIHFQEKVPFASSSVANDTSKSIFFIIFASNVQELLL